MFFPPYDGHSTSIICFAIIYPLSFLKIITHFTDSEQNPKNNRAVPAYRSHPQEYCLNLVGEIEVVTEQNIKSELWYNGLAEHYPDGATDPNYCVLKFTTKRYKLFVDWQEVRWILVYPMRKLQKLSLEYERRHKSC